MAALDGIQDGVVLTGNVWIDELYKSHRRTDEKKKRGISSRQTPIFVAVDSSWGILFMKSRSDGKPARDDAETMIKPHLGSEVTLITTDKNNCHAFIEGLGFKHESIKADVESIEFESKMKPVNDLCSHLKERLESHNGIAARYMQRYLILFWMIFNFAHRGLNTEKFTHYLPKLAKSGTRTKRGPVE